MRRFQILLLLSACLCFAQARPEWDDVSVYKVNVERPHATMMTYPSAALALQGVRTRSPWSSADSGRGVILVGCSMASGSVTRAASTRSTTRCASRDRCSGRASRC